MMSLLVPIKRLKFVSGVPSEDYFGEIDWLEEEKFNSFLEDTFIGLPSFVMFTSSLVLICMRQVIALTYNNSLYESQLTTHFLFFNK
ncbi:hypothetical protein QQP08_010253 [Theobroma cacao]|nr:hypothetical protein QQP08_010253 [Theobroma cacao]